MVERVGAFPRPHGVDRGAAESSAAASSVVVNSAAASSVVVNSVENLRRFRIPVTEFRALVP